MALQPPFRAHLLRWRQSLVLLAKAAVTVFCFWYVGHNIDQEAVFAAGRSLNPAYILAAVVVLGLQIPLIGLRWAQIVDSLRGAPGPIERMSAVAISAIGNFFSQMLPNFVGESMRIWFLVRLGWTWRFGLVSVIIDRLVGVGTLAAAALIALLLPSSLTALAGYNNLLIGIFGFALLSGLVALVFAPHIGTLLERSHYAQWAAKLVHAAHQVLLAPERGPRIVALGMLVHAMTIVAVWLLGQAQGLALPWSDAAVLFTVMVAVALVPISIGGWGLRELAVTALLGAHGVPVEQALLFSVSFGLLVILAALPGVIVWAFFSPGQSPS